MDGGIDRKHISTLSSWHSGTVYAKHQPFPWRFSIQHTSSWDGKAPTMVENWCTNCRDGRGQRKKIQEFWLLFSDRTHARSAEQRSGKGMSIVELRGVKTLMKDVLAASVNQIESSQVESIWISQSTDQLFLIFSLKPFISTKLIPLQIFGPIMSNLYLHTHLYICIYQ